MNAAQLLLTTTALAVVVAFSLAGCQKPAEKVASTASATPTPWPGGQGTIIMGNVPVAPGAYPDKGGDDISIRSKSGVKPETFTYGIAAPSASLANWYVARLQGIGWHIAGTATPNPKHPLYTIEGERKGEVVTAVINVVNESTARVTLLKLVSLR